MTNTKAIAVPNTPHVQSALRDLFTLLDYTDSGEDYDPRVELINAMESVRVIRESVEDAEQEELNSLVRHTTCWACKLDVEVFLDDVDLSGVDRGGSKLCATGARHLPILDTEDIETARRLRAG